MNKRNFTKQLLESIISEKNLTIKNLITGVIIVGIIGLIGVRLSFSYKEHINAENKDYIDDDYKIALLEEAGFSKIEIEEMDKNLYDTFSNKVLEKTKNQIAGEKHKKELPYSYSKDVKMDFYQHATNNDYEYIIGQFSKIKSKNYLSDPWNQSLIRIYNDAYTINSILSDKNNLSAQINALNNINDERMLLTAFLNSSIKARNSVLKDKLSLTLSKDNKNLRINSVISSTNSYISSNEPYKQDARFLRMLEYLNMGEFILYKINFDLSGDCFTAYMFKDLETFKLEMFGIYTDTPATQYKYVTVGESEEIESNMYKYNQSIR